MTTIKDIAELAEVSIATVSHVVKKTRYVSPKLTQKVETVIAELDTLPNFIIKHKEKEAALAIILVYQSDPTSSFEINVYNQLNAHFQRKSNTLVLLVEYTNLQSSFDQLSYLLKEQIKYQFVLVNSQRLPLVSKKFTKIPTVFISPNLIEMTSLNHVHSNGKRGLKKAMTHLVKNGHTKIAYLDNTNHNTTDLMMGYKESLLDYQIDFDASLFVTTPLLPEKLEKRLKQWFLSNTPATALLVSDTLLSAVILFFKKHHLLVPKDVSLIALNDDTWFHHYTPGISSIVHNYNDICSAALSLLASPWKNNVTHLQTNLELRSSTSGIGRGPFGEKAASIDIIELSPAEIEALKQTRRTAVISFHYTGSSWMTLHEKGIRSVFNQLNIDIIAITDALFTPSLQNKQIDSLLSLAPDLFIAIPTDNLQTAEAFKKITESSSKLILITNVPQGLAPSDYVTVVSVNESSHGRLAAQGLCEALIKDHKKQLAIISFGSVFYATNQRDMAAKQLILEEYPNINITAEITFTQEATVYNQTINLISHHPNIEGLYISWDGPAKEVLRALQDIKREDIMIGTADLDFPLALEMAKGHTIKTISAQQAFEQGKAIGFAAGQALLGKYVPSFIGIEPILVNKTNLLDSWKKIFQEDPPARLAKSLETETYAY